MQDFHLDQTVSKLFANDWLAAWECFTLSAFPLTSNSVRFECLQLATTLVFAHLTLLTIGAWWEPDEGWVSLNSIFLAEWLTSLSGAINFRNI